MEELPGVTAIWSEDFYDGAVDGLARQGDRYLWFCVDGSTLWFVEDERRYLLYELADSEAEECQLLHAEAQTSFSDRWGDESPGPPNDRPPIGWFVLDPWACLDAEWWWRATENQRSSSERDRDVP